MRGAGGGVVVFTMGFRVLGRGSEDIHAEIRKKRIFHSFMDQKKGFTL